MAVSAFFPDRIAFSATTWEVPRPVRVHNRPARYPGVSSNACLSLLGTRTRSPMPLQRAFWGGPILKYIQSFFKGNFILLENHDRRSSCYTLTPPQTRIQQFLVKQVPNGTQIQSPSELIFWDGGSTSARIPGLRISAVLFLCAQHGTSPL